MDATEKREMEMKRKFNEMFATKPSLRNTLMQQTQINWTAYEVDFSKVDGGKDLQKFYKRRTTQATLERINQEPLLTANTFMQQVQAKAEKIETYNQNEGSVIPKLNKLEQTTSILSKLDFMSKNKEAFESAVKHVENNDTASCIIYETALKKTFRQPVNTSVEP